MSNYLSTHFFKVINTRRQLYWLLQSTGWSGYVFFVMASAFFWSKGDSVHTVYTIVAAILGLLLSMIMRECYRKVWDRPPLIRMFYSFLTLSMTTGFWAMWKFYEYFQLYTHKKIENLIGEYVYWYSYSFFIFLS